MWSQMSSSSVCLVEQSSRQLGGRGRIKIHGRVGMLPHNGGRAAGGNFFGQRPADDVRLPLSRNRRDQPGHAKQSGNGQRDGTLRDRRKIGKPAFVHLLLTTFRVEGNDLDVERVLEIRFSRIVKSQMSVFPDPQQAELRVELPQQVSV